MAWARCCHGRWQMADGMLPVRAEGRWQMARCPSDGARGCRGEGRLGCRCCSAKPCAGADAPRLTAREASGDRARLEPRVERATAGLAARSGSGPPMPRLRRVRRSFRGGGSPGFAMQHRRPGRPAGALARPSIRHLACCPAWQMADGGWHVACQGRGQMADGVARCCHGRGPGTFDGHGRWQMVRAH